ncbi:hypothetical protein [Nonomuraea sp. NPDC050310]|uniref:hypothetical protein n=1 Tax=Nonomuraea sp. NPDC050310 TaxID=3154935 RepID=UPI0033D8792D
MEASYTTGQIMSGRWIRIKEVTARAGLSRWLISDLIKDGELDAFKAGEAKNAPVLVSEESLESYISRHLIPAARAS